ncbi:MAG: hypothetical protein ACRDH5_12775 [bacterium]
MGFQPVPDTAEVILEFSRGPDPATADWVVVNRHHWRDTVVPWNAANLTGLVNDILAWWNANLRPLTAANLRLFRIKATDLNAEFGAVIENFPNSPGTYGIVEAVAIQCAVVQWRGDPGGTPRRGRTYFGGLTEDRVVGDAIDGVATAALQAAYEQLALVDGVGTAALVLVSRFQGTFLQSHPDGTITREPTPRAAGVTNTIDTVAVRDVIGSQERRRRGD